MPKSVGMTLSEHLKQLNADPDWIAAENARERDRIARHEQLRREEKPLIDELATVGVVATSAWDLVNSPKPHKAALLILLSHLSGPYSAPVLEGIARALGRKEARPVAWDKLLIMLKTGALPGRAAEGAMAAVSAMARPVDLPILIDLIRDRSLGSKRVFLVFNLMRSKRPEARSTLVELKDDPDLCVEIAERLKRRRV